MKPIRIALLVAVAAAAIAQVDAGIQVRRPIAAGAWYPANPAQLFQAVQQYVTQAHEPDRPGRLLALIAPNSGYPYSGGVAGHPFSLLKPGQYDRVVVVTPSHHASFRGCSMPDVEFYRTPLGDVPCDRRAMDTLSRNGAFSIRAVIHSQQSRRQPLHEVEHGIEVLLPFLQVQLGQEFRLLPIVMGSLTDRAGGIDEAAERSVVQGLSGVIDDRTLLVVSTNFTHYGYEYNFVPFQTNVPDNIRALDFAAFERILNRDLNGLEQFFEESDSNIPGRLPLRILLQLLPERAAGTVLAYDTSGNVTGDWERSVSYAGIAFFDPRAEPPEQKPVRTLLSPPRHRPGAAADAPETAPESAPEPHKEPEAPEESTDEQSAPSGPE